jgi:acyl dehydratase
VLLGRPTFVEAFLDAGLLAVAGSALTLIESLTTKPASSTPHTPMEHPMTALDLPAQNTPFDPLDFAIVQAKTFEDLVVGDVFRAPSRTLTDAHSSAFQAVSADNHPVHYDAVWAKAHGHSAPVVHGLQVLAFTAPGATLFPHVIGEVFIAFTGLNCTFTAEVHSGDTLYSQLVIKSLEEVDGKGLVTTAVTVHNQNGDVVLTGEHEYLLRLTPGTAAGIAGE